MNHHPAFGLRDLIAVVVIATILIAVAIPTLAHPHGQNKRVVCATHLKGIGTSAKIYANDSNERWMIPGFRRQSIDNQGIDYLNNGTNSNGTYPDLKDEGEVGWDRMQETFSETASSQGQGSNVVSVTRAYWLLVRSGDATPGQFICPSSKDAVERTPRFFELDWYYDFAGYRNISYGYQVPFGPRDTQPREGSDNRQPFAADKGPYYLDNFEPRFATGRRNPVDFDDPFSRWRKYNSPNHRGKGQNVLFADGHVAFEYTPAVGVHGDNIYTLMTSEWDAFGFNLMHGQSPHFATAAAFPYPGQDAFGVGPNQFSSTDTLIYP